jgi:hypothetical protein
MLTYNKLLDYSWISYLFKAILYYTNELLVCKYYLLLILMIEYVSIP